MGITFINFKSLMI